MGTEVYERSKRAKSVMTPFSFLLPAAVLIVVCLIGGISPFGNATLINSLNSSFIENLERFRRTLSEEGSLFYSFSQGLGSGTFGTYARDFSSPLYLLSLFFQTSGIADAFLLITMLHMGLAGLTSYLFTSSLNDRAELCLGFAVAYGGCGCFFISVFSPAYAPAAVLLPAIGAGITALLKNGRVFLLASALVCFAVTSWQLLPAALFFTVAVFVWGTNVVEEKSTVKTAALRCTLVVLLTLCVCAVFAVPALLESAENGSAVRSMSDVPCVSLSELLSGLFMGNSAESGGNAMLYCSACTLVMLPVYLLNGKLPKGERVMAAGILLLLLLAQVLPPLAVIFNGFSASYECESGVSFVFCTCAVAFAARGLSVPSGITVGKAVGSWASAGVLYLIALLTGGSTGFLIMTVTAGFLTLYAAIVLVVMSGRRTPAIFGVVIMLCIFAEAVTAGADCIISAKEKGLPAKSEAIETSAAVESTVGTLLGGWEKTGGRSGISRVRGSCDLIDSTRLMSCQSVDSEKESPVLSALGISGAKGWTGVTDAIFGVRYLVSDENDTTYQALSVGDGIGLYENKNALSAGFAVSDIVQGVDLSLSSNPFTAQELLVSAALGEQRTVFTAAQLNEMRYDGATCNEFNESNLITRYDDSAVLSYTVTALRDGEMYMWISSTLPDNAAITINGEAQKDTDLGAIVSLGHRNALDSVTVEIELRETNTVINSVYFMTLDNDSFAAVMSILSSRQLTFVKLDGNILKAVADVQAGGIILTTVPYANGWSALVDGKAAETCKCLNGLLAVKASEGQHTLTLTYTPEGFNGCLAVSALSLLALLCCVIAIERKNKADLSDKPTVLPMPPGSGRIEPVEEGNVIPVVSPTLEVDLDFESEENTLDWL